MPTLSHHWKPASNFSQKIPPATINSRSPTTVSAARKTPSAKQCSRNSPRTSSSKPSRRRRMRRSSVFALAGELAAVAIALTAILCTLDAVRGSNAQPMETSAIQFANATAAAGIKFTHFRGNDGIPTNLEIFGPGVCVADYDADGYQDIYFVNGRDLHNRGIPARNALYRNNGDFTFTDVTEQAGVPGTGYGVGCVWGDYDNDG